MVPWSTPPAGGAATRASLAACGFAPATPSACGPTRQFALHLPVSDLRLILFDFGGTLDGPGVPWVDRFAVAYGKAGLDVPAERLRRAAAVGTRSAYDTPAVAGYDLRETVAFHVASQFSHLGIVDAAAAERIVAIFVRDATTALAASLSVLERLRHRFRLGIVSNFYGNLHRVLSSSGIAPLLSSIVDSTVAGVRKPDPRIFELAMAQVGVGATETLYVGDSLEQDIAPARALGLRTAWLMPPLAETISQEQRDSADLCLSALDDLERILCMKAAIIAAGHGERLRMSGISQPKPLVRVAGAALIDHTLRGIRTAGLRQVACIVNEESAAVETHCRERSAGLSITFLRRTTPSSMESLFALEPHLRGGTFLLLTVDAIIAPAAVREFMMAAIRRDDADAVLAVNSFIDDEKPLYVDCSADGRVRALGDAAAGSPLVTAGFYVLSPTIFAEVETARSAGFTALRFFLAHLLVRGYRMYAEHVPKCIDVDRPGDLATAEEFVRSGYRT
jgi:HAD superfamily hydrolase (TIGR01549 family)